MALSLRVTQIVFFLFVLNFIAAHQSGCHAWHSCPSDRGSYKCGDTGHCNYCPDDEYCLNGTFQITPATVNESTTIFTPTIIPSPKLEEDTPIATLAQKQEVQKLEQEIQGIKREQQNQKTLLEKIIDFLKSMFFW